MDLIFFQLISDILGYLRFIFPYGIHILVCKDSTKTVEALIYKGFYGFVFEI